MSASMADDGVVVLYDTGIVTTDPTNKNPNPFSIKVGLTQILRGGAIIEVSNPRQAKIAENAGACCISIASDQRGIGRMADPSLIKEIKRSVSIPVISKARVGHFVEAQILESTGSDYIDENELLSIADEDHFINKHKFRVPFVCGSTDFGEALRRIREGAALIRTQGDVFGSGNIAQTVGNVRKTMAHIRVLNNTNDDEVFSFAKKIGAPYDLVAQTKQMGRLPVAHFASGGIVTPADAALMMQLGCDGVFIGPEVFDGLDPVKHVRAIVEAVRNHHDPGVLAEVSSGLSDAMASLNINDDKRVVEV
ncbi:Pyridoxal 5'-phosphate synthase-like subunit PDX1.2 [Bienertia sinuspersici]